MAISDNTITGAASGNIQGSNNNQVSIPGIVLGAVVGCVVVVGVVLLGYKKLKHRGLLNNLSMMGLNRTKSQLPNPPDDEESLKKRASFVSERESIMFRNSEASSLRLAIVEDYESERRIASQVYVLQDRTYVTLEEENTEENSLLSRDASHMPDVDISSIDSGHGLPNSIDLIVSPPSVDMHLNKR